MPSQFAQNLHWYALTLLAGLLLLALIASQFKTQRTATWALAAMALWVAGFTLNDTGSNAIFDFPYKSEVVLAMTLAGFICLYKTITAPGAARRRHQEAEVLAQHSRSVAAWANVGATAAIATNGDYVGRLTAPYYRADGTFNAERYWGDAARGANR